MMNLGCSSFARTEGETMLFENQKKKHNHQAYLLWFFLISLLIHALLVFLFSSYGFQGNSFTKLKELFKSKQESKPTIIMFQDQKVDEKHEQQIIMPESPEQKQVAQEKTAAEPQPLPIPIINVTPAQLIAPLSSFGYPDAQADAVSQPEVPDSPDGSIEQASSAPIVQSTAKQTPHKQKETLTPTLEEESTLAPTQEQAQKTKDSTQTSVLETLSDIDTNKLAQTTSKLMDRIRAVEKVQKKQFIDQKQADAQKSYELEVNGPEVKVRGARKEDVETKPKKNIIALTKGFVEKLSGQHGTDLIDRDGDPNQRPSFEELRFIGYEAKINWALQASWKQNFEYSTKHKPIPGTVDVAFIIDTQGNPQNITIVQSSGQQELDQTIIHNIKNAAPFPPIPDHLNMAEYPVRRSIRVHLYGRGF